MFHLQSPKGKFAERITSTKAPKTWIFIEKIGTKVTFSKKFGLEIVTSMPGVLLVTNVRTCWVLWRGASR
jgi:hypothetical protein